MSTVRTPTPSATYPTLSAEQSWPAQGQWTYEDFLRLPDDGNRYEIIDGVFYMTNAPDPEHQYAVHQIAVAFELAVRAGNLGVVYTGPIEVHLPGIAQPVQPDVLFVAQARREIVKPKFIEGTPDLIVEVTSPSTARLDRKVKLDAYERAGVLECWIVNPKLHSIEVYTLVRGEYALHGEYGPGEQVTSEVLTGLELLTDAVFTA
jgi:Uma2 family endonuclease